jgi:hemerythrin-like domain-containing protein
MKTTDALTQEHKLILRALDVLDEMAAAAEAGLNVSPDDMDVLANFFLGFVDQLHEAKEESIFFPALKAAAAGREHRAVEHMVFEHKRDRSQIGNLREALRSGNVAQFVKTAGQVGSAFRNHIYKEDHILYEAATQMIDTVCDEDLMRRMARFDEEHNGEQHNRLIGDLRWLESKYLRKNGSAVQSGL